MTKKAMGIDVDSRNLVCCIVVDEDKSKAVWKTFENREKDFCKILEYLRDQKVMRVLLEASGGYEQKIAIYLASNKISVYVVNPRRARDFARGIGLNYKNDNIDAFALGRMAQVAQFPPTTHACPNQQKLKQFVIRRNQIVDMIVEEKNRNRLTGHEVRENILKHIEFLEDQKAELEKTINALIQSDQALNAKKRVLVKLIGISDVTAAAMIALIPELGYIGNNEVSSLVGVAPMDNDSGKKKGKRSISGGRAHARKALYMPAWVAVQRDPRMQIVYERHIKRGKLKKVAIVAIMKKLLITANAVVRKHLEDQKIVA
jgi:transposase